MPLKQFVPGKLYKATYKSKKSSWLLKDNIIIGDEESRKLLDKNMLDNEQQNIFMFMKVCILDTGQFKHTFCFLHKQIDFITSEKWGTYKDLIAHFEELI